MVDSGKGVLLRKIQKNLHHKRLKGLKKLVQQYFLIINKAMRGAKS